MLGCNRKSLPGSWHEVLHLLNHCLCQTKCSGNSKKDSCNWCTQILCNWLTEAQTSDSCTWIQLSERIQFGAKFEMTGRKSVQSPRRFCLSKVGTLLDKQDFDSAVRLLIDAACAPCDLRKAIICDCDFAGRSPMVSFSSYKMPDRQLDGQTFSMKIYHLNLIIWVQLSRNVFPPSVTIGRTRRTDKIGWKKNDNIWVRLFSVLPLRRSSLGLQKAKACPHHRVPHLPQRSSNCVSMPIQTKWLRPPHI